MLSPAEYSVYDDVPWIKELHSYVEDVRATHPHVKLIGVCWGHQLLGQVLGVPCQMVPTRELGPVRISLSPEGKALCLSVLPDHAAVNAGVLVSVLARHKCSFPLLISHWLRASTQTMEMKYRSYQTAAAPLPATPTAMCKGSSARQAPQTPETYKCLVSSRIPRETKRPFSTPSITAGMGWCLRKSRCTICDRDRSNRRGTDQ